MAYVNGKNQTILAAIPQPPPYFFNVTKTGGINVVGSAFYSPTKATFLNGFHKSTGLPLIKNRHQNFIIGVLIVLLIQIIADIVRTILLRSHSRSRTVTSSGVYTAYLIDEFSHVRNLWMHATSKSNSGNTVFGSVFGAKATKLSLLALIATIVVFFTDVLALHLSQKGNMYSSSADFNLRAFQPIGTYGWRARGIRQRSEFSPCISPYVLRPFHRRHFLLSTCIFSESKKDLDKKKDVSEEISFGSWYHRGGSDHTISFGKGMYRISVRAEMILSGTGSRWKLLFNTSGNVRADTQFIHNKTIHAAMQFACNKEFSKLACLDMLDDLKVMSLTDVKRTVRLWKEGERQVEENVTGLVSKFRVRINQPYSALGKTMHFLMASSAVMDVGGMGWYEDANSGRQESGIAGLISENGRVAGIPIILITVMLSVVVLGVLRLCLRSVSLGSLAVYHMEREWVCGRRRALRKEMSRVGEKWALGAANEEEWGASRGESEGIRRIGKKFRK